MPKYLVALDQGTTSSRAIVFTAEGGIVASHAVEFAQHYPHPGWVEHDPEDILESQVTALQEAVRLSGIDAGEIAAIGITNQRETTLLWDRKTGKCVGNAIVWQCRRTSQIVERLIADGHGEMIREKTGLVPDAYFSGTKLKWMLDYYQLHERAERGELCFGTVDSFLCWNLLTGRPHVTDATNAGRTMLFNLKTQDWDEDLLRLLEIPRACLPRVVDSSGLIGTLDPAVLGRPIPVTGMAGDQHASLFGQACWKVGDVKNTYGTGCFMLMNTGDQPARSQNGLLTTMAWRMGGKPTYALEGSVFMGGATIQWLRDELKMISRASESEGLAESVNSTGGVYLVPAMTGLGAPWWDMYSRGTLVGMTRGTGRAHIVRAALEAIAYQSEDLMQAMIRDSGRTPERLQVDGGASANAFLMQFQADISHIPVVRPQVLETTALGAALLAGLGCGMYSGTEELAGLWKKDLEFTPRMDEATRRMNLRGWHKAVERSLDFAEH
ncbi:MAG: glycerol kinase GlpK [Clostridiales bacterium]|nr:glycerol kinase GlpK [Clostridiales bacterium]